MIRHHKRSKWKCFSETTGRPLLQNPVFSPNTPLFRAAIFMFALLTLDSWSDGAESTRLNFGARLEPTDGRLIVGAGQRPEGFKDYYDSIGANKPVVYMTYMEMKKTQEFMAASMEHRRPVMIGESSPKGMRLAKGPKIWESWFDPYFEFIHRYENVKAFCYINQDWDAIGTWKGWGDSRLSQTEKILKKFQEQIGMAMFLHGADREQTLKALHVKE